MEGFIEFIKYYSMVLVCLMEIVLIYNFLVLLVNKKSSWLSFISIIIYAPLLFLCVWVLIQGGR